MYRKPSFIVLHWLLIAAGLVALSACKKHKSDNTQTDSEYPCVVINCPSYFGSTQTFTYDSKQQMTKRSYSFNSPGYSDFTQTINANQTFYSYTQSGNLEEETDLFVGGLYTGTPTMKVRTEHQKYANGNPDYYSQPDSIFFGYDAKGRLAFVSKPYRLHSDNVLDYYTRHIVYTDLDIVYDDNDNAIALKQWEVYQYGTYVVQAPSESTLILDSTLQTSIKMTYDSKSSPFIASLKYWKFVQDDWGLAINTNWMAIITALSKSNPLTVTYDVQSGSPSTTKYTMSYNYTSHGMPADSYTYNCTN
jgi:hypothetical protein